MIVPSIDVQDGQTVQLVGGRERALSAGDPRTVAEELAMAGELALIDLDAAMGKGSNQRLLAEVVAAHPCRVGGGIRSYEAARDWLDRGARQVILGTAAQPELLRRLPRRRVIAAVDAVNGEVVVEGWTTRTGASLLETVRVLSPHVGGFLVTFVEREGRLGGTALEQVPALLQAAGKARLTVAGGITTAAEIAALDRLGVDAQVGMALYTGRLALGDAVAAPLVSDRADGLFPTVVCDEHGVALGMAYSSAESLREALATRRGVYHSRRRGRWEKGATSGATQQLLRVDVDCDRDTLRFTVRQAGAGFCHEQTWSCWGETTGLPALERVLRGRREHAPAGSYTRRLFTEPGLLEAKLREEARELGEAETFAEVTHEVADVMYFALVAAARAGVPLEAVGRELDRRALRLSRRPGDAKEER